MNIKALAIEPMRKIPKSKPKKVLVAACPGGEGGEPSKIFKSQEMLAAMNKVHCRNKDLNINITPKCIQK